MENTKLQQRIVSSIFRRDHFEQYDLCIMCNNEIDISEINIFTGCCCSCKRPDNLKKMLEKGLKYERNIHKV